MYSREKTLALPLKTFWFMSGCVDRIEARKDMRSLTVAICGQSSESAKEFRQELIIEAGTIVKIEAGVAQINAVRDEEGFAELKAMSKSL